MPSRLVPALLLALLAAVAPAADKDVDQLLQEGITGLTQFSFDWPRGRFREARERSQKGTPQWQQATFGLATCQQQYAPPTPEAITEAAALYAELAAAAPESPFTPRCVLNLGRIAELSDWYGDVVDLAEARKRYEEVVRRWPQDPIAGEATLRLAASHVATLRKEDLETGVRTLETWLAAHPQDPLAAAMWQYLGDVHFLHREDPARALDAYIKADQIGLLWASREGTLWWRMAVLAERVGRRDVAIHYYETICKEAQTSGRAFESQLALARLGVQPPELTAFSGYQGEKPVFEIAAPPAGGAP